LSGPLIFQAPRGWLSGFPGREELISTMLENAVCAESTSRLVISAQNSQSNRADAVPLLDLSIAQIRYGLYLDNGSSFNHRQLDIFSCGSCNF
jgi:hypothetical protein